MKSSLYILGPPESTSWRLDRDEFVAALSALWPEADIAVPIDPNALSRLPITWSVRSWDGEEEVPPWLDGSLDSPTQASTLRGDPELVTEYVLWLRRLIPALELVLVVDNDREPLAILPSTTSQEVMDFIR